MTTLCKALWNIELKFISECMLVWKIIWSLLNYFCFVLIDNLNERNGNAVFCNVLIWFVSDLDPDPPEDEDLTPEVAAEVGTGGGELESQSFYFLH